MCCLVLGVVPGTVVSLCAICWFTVSSYVALVCNLMSTRMQIQNWSLRNICMWRVCLDKHGYGGLRNFRAFKPSLTYSNNHSEPKCGQKSQYQFSSDYHLWRLLICLETKVENAYNPCTIKLDLIKPCFFCVELSISLSIIISEYQSRRGSLKIHLFFKY